MTGLSTPPALYTPTAAPGATLAVADHDEGLHAPDRTAIRALYLEAWALGLPLTINGNMDHFQGVGGSGSAVPTTTYNTTTSYAADQMYVLPAGATLTSASRSTSVPDSKSRYSLAVVGAASVTTVNIGQRIESAVVNTRGKQSLVFSCYVRNESGAAFTPNLQVGTPGAADDFTTVTNRLDQSLQLCADSAWTRVYHVFDPTAYTNIANGMDVALRVPSGSLVASDTVRVAQFDLRAGSALSPFLPPDPALELIRALPYFERITSWGTSAAFGFGVAAGAVDARFLVTYARKRTNPTLTFSDNSDLEALNAAFSAAGAGTLSTATAGPTTAQCRMNTIATITLTQGNAVMIRWTDSDGYINVNARL